MKDKIIQFVRTKDFRFLEYIGQGGTGKTVLIRDEIINEDFICKKYQPWNKADREQYFKNFIDEIKLLHLVYHQNLVRVFNYYLYPAETTGYIIMEYVKGKDIATYIQENPEKIDGIFKQTINGFAHLQDNKILHRDIRPLNILVSNEGVVKIIDFGFGKKITFDEDYDKSISLNWPFEPPDEFTKHIYDFKTEIYFVGKLFEEIITDNDIKTFSYRPLLKKMTASYSERTSTFFEITRSILEGGGAKGIQFTELEKTVYRNLVGQLTSAIFSVLPSAEYHDAAFIIGLSLDSVLQANMLEETIQDNGKLIGAFIKGGFSYRRYTGIPVDDVQAFATLLETSSIEKQKIILNNLWGRLDAIERREFGESVSSDDLPF